ncbi:MAG: hypothetical protein U0M21_06510 [Emergencia sp.]|nr:hypothetical protein [Emergencia sp.]
MKKKSMMIFMLVTVLSVGMTVYGWTFVDSRIGQAELREETVTGNKAAADGLTVSFRADSADSLHWINHYDYSTGRTESSFKRGEMNRKADSLVYDDIRFTGWSAAPYVTRLDDVGLEGLQEKEIQGFYEDVQNRVIESGAAETGKIRVKDYLDFYPVSFRFQFGTKLYNSDDALTGLKIYAENGATVSEREAAYDEDVALYATFNHLFKIPVIDNEYQTYKVSPKEEYNPKKDLGYTTEIEKPLGEGEDYYTFDPVIVLQEENIKDGKSWFHPDLTGGLSYEAGSENGDESDDSYIGKSAAAYNLKNRMLFAVNNRTVKGEPVDVSQLSGGYGVYELPFEVMATASISKGQRSRTVTNPVPILDEIKMVYPLDEQAEYIEMSLSGDHRYLSVFSVKDGKCFVEMIDADNWTSPGPIELFSASEKMIYAWGEDNSLTVTNHKGDVAVLYRSEKENSPYEVLYSGKTESGLDKALFDTASMVKEHSEGKYVCVQDSGLAVTVKEGKAALVQTLLTGDPAYNLRNAALECAVIDKSGVIYRGRLKSNLVDLEYDMNSRDAQSAKELLDLAKDGKEDSALAKYLIEPVSNENRAEWK